MKNKVGLHESSRLLLASLFLFSTLTGTGACTTAVISGKATSDGRPLLWKNRDSDNLQNQVVFAADGKYSYIGIINTGDAAGMEIWAGINSEGFAIMNSASYNLDTGVETEGEGRFMKLALQSCATVSDFQDLLDKTNQGGRDVNANFGVIDAKGGASYFETDRKRYHRFDAAGDSGPREGFIVRSNYSDSGVRSMGTGFFRRSRAADLVGQLGAAGQLNAGSLLGSVCRDISNPAIGSFPLENPGRPGPKYAYTGDSICRYDTSSSAVFAGVREGENPLLSVAWIVLGQPVTGVAVPLWVRAGCVPPEVAASPKAAPLNGAFDSVRDIFYPDARGEMKKYIDLGALSKEGDRLLPGLMNVEANNFKVAGEALFAWASKIPSPKEAAGVQAMICRETLSAVNALLKRGG